MITFMTIKNCRKKEGEEGGRGRGRGGNESGRGKRGWQGWGLSFSRRERNDRLVWISPPSSIDSSEWNSCGQIDERCERWLTRLSKSKSWISIKESCRRSNARPAVRLSPFLFLFRIRLPLCSISISLHSLINFNHFLPKSFLFLWLCVLIWINIVQ